MKKILCLFIISFVLSVNIVFAADTNINQINMENELKKDALIEQCRLMGHYLLIQQDKEMSDENSNADTIYNRITHLIKSAKNDINRQYTQKAMQVYMTIALQSEPPKIEDFKRIKIFIPDSIFKLLDEDLVDIICFLNTY